MTQIVAHGEKTMCDIDSLISKGYDLCFGEINGDRIQGRKFLENAASLGRDDALLYLGKSYELEGNYSDAENAYLRGFERRYRAAIFRLAMLHGRKLLQNNDRDFFLRTIKALSRDGHFPSIAIYTNERIRGSYGLIARIGGVLSVVPNAIRFIWTFARNPKNHLFEQ